MAKGGGPNSPSTIYHHWHPIGSGFCRPRGGQQSVLVCNRILRRRASKASICRLSQQRKYHFEETTSPVPRCPHGQDPCWKHEYACRYEISYTSGPRRVAKIKPGKSTPSAPWATLDAWTPIMGGSCYGRETTAATSEHGDESLGHGRHDTRPNGEVRLVVGAGRREPHRQGRDRTQKSERETQAEALDCPDPGYDTGGRSSNSGGVRQLVVCIYDRLLFWLGSGRRKRCSWSEPADVKLGDPIASPIFDPKTGPGLRHLVFNGPLMMKLAPGQASSQPALERQQQQ